MLFHVGGMLREIIPEIPRVICRFVPFPATQLFVSSAPPFRFFPFSFFRLLRSRFLKLVMLALHTSAYRAKNASKASGCTIVLILTLSGFLVVLSPCVDFPSVARMMSGSGFSGLRSQRGSSAILAGGVGASAVSNVTELDVSDGGWGLVGADEVLRFWVKWTEPWPFR